MRLIDADELKNLPFERMIHTDFGETAIPIEEIDNAPTVETKECPYSCEKCAKKMICELGKEIKRLKGKWIPISPDCRGYPEYFKCSICGAYIHPYSLEKELDYNGCPYCFADMREEGAE